MLLPPILPCEGAKIGPATLRKYRKFKRLREFANLRAYWLSDRVAAATPEELKRSPIRRQFRPVTQHGENVSCWPVCLRRAPGDRSIAYRRGAARAFAALTALVSMSIATRQRCFGSRHRWKRKSLRYS